MKFSVSNISAFAVLSFVLLALSSCEKPLIEGGTEEESTENRVVLTVGEVETYINGEPTRSSLPIEQVCSRLCFAVYQGGTRVKYDNQKVGDSDFGTCTMSLEAGHYQLLILGHSGNANPSTTKPEQIKFTNLTASGGTGYTDTFYYYGDLEVTSGMPERTYTLERATAMFRLVVKDAKPDAVKRFYFYYTGGSGAFNAATGLGSVNSKQDVRFDVTSGQKEFDLYTFLHSDEGAIRLKVTALDVNGAEAYNREYDVSLKQNHITRCTSPYF